MIGAHLFRFRRPQVHHNRNQHNRHHIDKGHTLDLYTAPGKDFLEGSEPKRYWKRRGAGRSVTEMRRPTPSINASGGREPGSNT